MSGTLGTYSLHVLAALVLLAAAAGVLVWLARRWMMGGGREGGHIKIVDQLPLGVGLRLVLIEAEGQRLLVGVTPQRISLLCKLPQPGSENSDE